MLKRYGYANKELSLKKRGFLLKTESYKPGFFKPSLLEEKRSKLLAKVRLKEEVREKIEQEKELKKLVEEERKKTRIEDL